MAAADPYWLGPLGAMLRMPSPTAEGFPARYDRTAALQRSLTGGGTVDVLGVHRVWELAYRYRTDAEANELIARWTSPLTTDPLRLIDPLTPNRLSLDAAAAGGVSGTAEAAGRSAGTLSRVTVDPGPPALRRLVDSAYRLDLADGQGADLVLDPTLGFPVLDGETFTARGWLRGTAQAAWALGWALGSGGAGSESTGAPIALSATTWSLVEITAATPPAGAVAGVAALRVPAGAGDRWLEATGFVVTARPDELDGWAPGGGSPAVLLEEFQHDYQRLGRRAMTLTVREV